MRSRIQLQNQLVAMVVNEMRRAHSHLVLTKRRFLAFCCYRGLPPFLLDPYTLQLEVHERLG
jgi:hypothetical protein